MKKFVLKTGDACEYYWNDCQTFDDVWTDKSELDEMFEKKKKDFKNIGYFLKEHKGFYLFTEGISSAGTKDECYFNVTMIPKGQMIGFKKVKSLRQ